MQTHSASLRCHLNAVQAAAAASSRSSAPAARGRLAVDSEVGVNVDDLALLAAATADCDAVATQNLPSTPELTSRTVRERLKPNKLHVCSTVRRIPLTGSSYACARLTDGRLVVVYVEDCIKKG